MNSLQIAYFIVFIWGGGEPNEIPGSRINQTGNSNSQGTVTSGDGRSNNEDVTNSVATVLKLCVLNQAKVWLGPHLSHV
jgi:hypothetical protein